MRADREGAKIVKNRGLLPTDRYNAVKNPEKPLGEFPTLARIPTIRSGHLMRPNRGFALASGIAARGDETRYAPVAASRTGWRRIQIETRSTE
jgi:hypothetical protein